MSVSTQNWKKRLEGGLWEVTRRTVSMAGKVTDSQSGNSINGVKVTVHSGSRRYKTYTGDDGCFHFLDLQGGKYLLCAKMPSSIRDVATVQVQATPYHDVNGKVKRSSKGEHKANISTRQVKGEGMSIDAMASSETGDLIITL